MDFFFFVIALFFLQFFISFVLLSLSSLSFSLPFFFSI